MTTFALRLGVRQSTISGYESGKVRPSRTILILLFQLAIDGNEKSPILDAMGVDEDLRSGWGESELLEAVKDFDIHASAKKTEKAIPRRPWKRGSLIDFAEQATLIVKELGDVDPCMVDLLRLWVAHHKNPKAVEDFRELVEYMRIRLSRYTNEKLSAQLAPSKPSSKRSPSE